MATFCDVIQQSWSSRDVFGNGNILTAYCGSLSPLAQYNQYCTVPTTNQVVLNACQNLAVTNDLEDDLDFYYQQFLRNRPSDWPVYPIAAAGYVLGEPLTQPGQLLQTVAGGDTMGFVRVLKFAPEPGDPFAIESEFRYATLQNLAFRPIPEYKGQQVTDDVFGFGVDDSGCIYFATSTATLDPSTFLLQFFKYVPDSLEPEVVVAEEIKMFSSSIGNFAVSKDGLHFCLLTQSNSDLEHYALLTVDRSVEPPVVVQHTTFGTLPISFITRNRNLLLSQIGVNRANQCFLNVPRENGLYYFNGTTTVRPSGPLINASPTLDNNGQIYGISDDKQLYRLSGSTWGSLITVDEAATRMDQTPDGRVLLFVGNESGTLYQFRFSTQDATRIYGQNLNPNDSIINLTIMTAVRRAFFVTAFRGDNQFRVVEPDANDSKFNLLQEWVDEDTVLCDNGDIAVIDEAKQLVVSSNTQDGNRTTLAELQADNFVELDRSQNTLSSNGLYIFVGEDSPSGLDNQLIMNLPNLPGLVEFCDDRFSLCESSYEAYCIAQRTSGSVGIQDPRCRCLNRDEQLLGSLFPGGLEQLRANPVLYNQLVTVAPCISIQCGQFREEDNLIGALLSQVRCPDTLTICSSTVALADGSQLNGDVFQTVSCGGGVDDPNKFCDENTDCPIGSVCAGNECRVLCLSSDQCGAGELCNTKNQCVPKSEIDNDQIDNTGGGWSTTAVVTCSVLGALALILLIVILVKVYRK